MMDYRDFIAEQNALGTSELEMSARWWDLLATAEGDRTKWDKYAGTTGYARAHTYRRTAESLRIQERTGVAVCACCHKPLGGGYCITRQSSNGR